MRSDVVQLRVGTERATTSALRDGALRVTGEPLAGVVEVKDVLALEAECGEPGGHRRASTSPSNTCSSTPTQPSPAVAMAIRPRHRHYLQADYAPWQVPAAVWAAHARADVGLHEWVTMLLWGSLSLGLGLTTRPRRAR